MNNSFQAEFGMLYTETPEDIAMEKAISEEWDLLDSMYISNFRRLNGLLPFGSRLTPASCDACALQGLHMCTASSSVTCVVNLNYKKTVLTRVVDKMEQERATAGYLLRRDEYRATLRAERNSGRSWIHM
jgi:hypothetical protein